MITLPAVFMKNRCLAALLVFTLVCLLGLPSAFSQDVEAGFARASKHFFWEAEKGAEEKAGFGLESSNVEVYKQASQIGDHATAIVALHNLLVKKPGGPALQDALAIQYYYSGQRTVCLAWCAKCLNERPESSFLLHLSGLVAEEQEALETALGRYERLYAMRKAPFYRYKVASLRYQLGRHGECLPHLQAMLQSSEIESVELYLTWAGGEGYVLLRAALLNLRGNLELALKQTGKARKSFRAALKVSPDFALPQLNLNAMRTHEEERWENMSDR